MDRTDTVTYESESVTEVLDYYPYGSTRIDQTTNNFRENKQYVAQYSDPETSLSYLQARYYDGSKGEFLSEDPIFLGDPKQQALTDPQSLNSYSYANDNPITKSDPTGKCGEDACVLEGSLAIAGAAAGFAGTYPGDVLQNRSDGKTGLAAYAFRSSPSQYAAAIGTGAVAAPLAAYSLTAAAV
jgi:RHS repeat-associated protein